MSLWTQQISISVPGTPVAKGRPRLGRYGTYTPEKTKGYERVVAWHAASSRRGQPIRPSTPVRVVVTAVFPRPQRLKRVKDPSDLIPHVVAPDLDNVIKAVLDGLNGVIYKDDKQVVSICATAWYAEKGGLPRTEIEVSTLNQHQPTNTGTT